MSQLRGRRSWRPLQLQAQLWRQRRPDHHAACSAARGTARRHRVFQSGHCIRLFRDECPGGRSGLRGKRPEPRRSSAAACLMLIARSRWLAAQNISLGTPADRCRPCVLCSVCRPACFTGPLLRANRLAAGSTPVLLLLLLLAPFRRQPTRASCSSAADCRGQALRAWRVTMR